MTELEKKLINALLMIRDHINEPKVITSIIDKNIGTDKDLMLETFDGPNEDSKKMATDIQDKLNKAATDEKINMASGAEPTPTPHPLSSDDEWSDDNDKEHKGFEGQADGMDEIRNILLGTKEGPNDNRW